MFQLFVIIILIMCETEYQINIHHLGTYFVSRGQKKKIFRVQQGTLNTPQHY